MKNKISSVILLSFFSVAANAYEAMSYTEAKNQQPEEIKKSVEISKPVRDSSEHFEAAKRDLLRSYISAEYLANDSSGQGFNAALSAEYNDFELVLGYRDLSSDVTHGGQTYTEDFTQMRAEILAPLYSDGTLTVQIGGSYVKTEMLQKAQINNSFFGTVKFTSLLSDLVSVYAAADFEIASEDAVFDEAVYDFHDDVTGRAGAEFYLLDNFSVGANVAFGSQLDTSYSIQVKYIF